MGQQAILIARNKYEEALLALQALQPDAEKFYDKGNAAAGTRVRVGIQKVKTLLQESREEIKKRKNSDN
jgi:hypothetical protein